MTTKRERPKQALRLVAIAVGIAIAFGVVAIRAQGQSGQANGSPFAVILNKLNEIMTALNTPPTAQFLPGSSRFVVLSAFNNEAVLDRESGLVWEKTPSTSLVRAAPPLGTQGGIHAGSHCISLTTGSRQGWRLPAINELMGLLDTSQPIPFLPDGHQVVTASDSVSAWPPSSTRELPAHEVAKDRAMAV
jgi:hypothetical protein